MSLQKKLKSGTQATLEVVQGAIVTGCCHFLGGLGKYYFFMKVESPHNVKN
jgi:hypothetical protein